MITRPELWLPARRFVEVRLQPGSPAVQLCEVQVHLLVPPASPFGDAGARGGSGRKLLGAVASLLAGAGALAFLASLGKQSQAAERKSLQQPLLAGADRAAPSLANYPVSQMAPASGETLSTVAERSRSGGSGSGTSSRTATGSGGSLGSRPLGSAELSTGTPRRTSQLEAAAAYISGVRAPACLHSATMCAQSGRCHPAHAGPHGW